MNNRNKKKKQVETNIVAAKSGKIWEGEEKVRKTHNEKKNKKKINKTKQTQTVSESMKTVCYNFNNFYFGCAFQKRNYSRV